MKKIEIFDPAMCCSTGVCGPSIDPELLRMATVVSSLKERGVVIQRHGLATEPQDFIVNEAVNALLQKEGADVLPLTLLDGKVVKSKAYPTNHELSEWIGVEIEIQPPEKSSVCCCGPKGCC
jgi:hypothetical protein